MSIGSVRIAMLASLPMMGNWESAMTERRGLDHALNKECLREAAFSNTILFAQFHLFIIYLDDHMVVSVDDGIKI